MQSSFSLQRVGGLVFRFRSSHHFAANSGANFGIKGTLAMSTLSSAAYGFEVPIRDCRELIGTSNPPHQSEFDGSPREHFDVAQSSRSSGPAVGRASVARGSRASGSHADPLGGRGSRPRGPRRHAGSRGARLPGMV